MCSFQELLRYVGYDWVSGEELLAGKDSRGIKGMCKGGTIEEEKNRISLNALLANRYCSAISNANRWVEWGIKTDNLQKEWPK
jgi:hypothetical protein